MSDELKRFERKPVVALSRYYPGTGGEGLRNITSILSKYSRSYVEIRTQHRIIRYRYTNPLGKSYILNVRHVHYRNINKSVRVFLNDTERNLTVNTSSICMPLKECQGPAAQEAVSAVETLRTRWRNGGLISYRKSNPRVSIISTYSILRRVGMCVEAEAAQFEQLLKTQNLYLFS
jgi:hypothetical protein